MICINCPSCGAPIEFRSPTGVYAVCAYCGSTVLRTDRDVALIGKQADLPDEISPLQIGTKFTYAGQHYELLGRARIGWSDGAWTEWFAQGETRQAWLAEAQGALAIAYEQPVPAALASATPPLGSVIGIDAEPFRVTDIKQATCIGAEGELPFAAPRGRTARYLDMISPSGAFAGLEIAADERRFYRGEYVEFDALGFTGLREIEGWRPPTTPAQADPRSPQP